MQICAAGCMAEAEGRVGLGNAIMAGKMSGVRQGYEWRKEEGGGGQGREGGRSEQNRHS